MDLGRRRGTFDGSVDLLLQAGAGIVDAPQSSWNNPSASRTERAVGGDRSRAHDKENTGMTSLRDPDGLPTHWWRSATHYERQPWRPRVMVLYELRAAGPRRYAYAIEAERSLGVYPSVGEAIAAVEAELARRARPARPPRARPTRRAWVADSRQFDLFTLPSLAPEGGPSSVARWSRRSEAER
jgi:hypothetical protein